MKASIQKLINKQIGFELSNANLYFGISNKLAVMGYANLSKWFNEGAKDEQGHAQKLIDFMNAKNIEIVFTVDGFDKIEASLDKIASSLLERERQTTKEIWNIYDKSQSEGCFDVSELMLWFIHEQVEEEDKALQLVDDVKILGNNLELKYII